MSNAINFMSSTTVICTNGFLVMVTGLTDDAYMYAFSLFTVISQIFFMAWIGDKLTETVRFLSFQFFSTILRLR